MTAVRRLALSKKVDDILDVISNKKEEIKDLEKRLSEIQDECDHSGVGTYRDHQIGTCLVCMKEFMTRSQIDAIYSE